MPRNEISVFVIDAPPPDQPVLWTAEVEAAILAKQGTVVKRALKVTPWKDPNGSWAKAVDTDGNHWIGCRSKGRDVWNKWRTKASMGEAYYETGPGKRTKAVMGEEAFRATGRGQRNATESARLVAARGEGETPDGLTAEERETLASRVAMEVCAVVNEWLTSDSKASAYIAIGTWERMVSNLIAAQESGWMNLARCEIFASLLRTNPSAFVLVNGQAQRFTTALIREVRWLAQSLQHLPSGPM